MASAEEDPQASKANVGISVMLLGSIGFMMALFELTHCYRAKMAKYTWKSISATISIFSAVLIFQGANGIVEAYITEGAPLWVQFLVSVVHLLLWFVGLQLDLAVITGVVKVPCFDPRFDDLEIMESRLKTFAILMGHTTGFAAINCFATFQQLVPRNFLTTFLVAPLAWLLLYSFGRVTDSVRERVALLGDNEKTKNEEMWDEEIEETEDDVIGLAVSFCFVQSVRFLVGGTLPNPEGEEPDEVMVSHSDMQSLTLITVGCLLGLFEALRVLYIKKTIERITPQGKNIIAMTLSWCIFFGTDGFLSHNLFTHEHGMMKTVTLALTVTVVALAMIFALEQLQDCKHIDDSIDEAIRAVVNAIGILIGFAWEKAFDVAVAEITAKVDVLPDPVTKMLLAILLAGTVVPAWYRHILPVIIAMEAEEERENEGSKEGEALGDVAEAEEGKKGTLSEPLLSEKNNEKAELIATFESYKKTIAELEEEAARANELEQKNRELENAIGTINQELGELQKLAAILHN
eukprot:CAMPEP_0115611142 /NCGR_PEP_ID=MMETSP0272-20121206/20379_1 /TAXON_ID=71861 /ORGANISM="Scrippsiella trochoidea, Strain CCMP3099" /LENGTH=519 /DNA_ID=CAMNT_0003046863 /DNA_START=62 /DNA_END=1621 /DNA_ORIENTATION=+